MAPRVAAGGSSAAASRSSEMIITAVGLTPAQTAKTLTLKRKLFDNNRVRTSAYSRSNYVNFVVICIKMVSE